MDHTVFGFTKERLLLPKFATLGSRYFFLRLFFDAVPNSTSVSCYGVRNNHIKLDLATCGHNFLRLF